MISLERLKIFDDEFINASCENTIDYQGKSELKGKLSGDDDLEQGDLLLNYKDSLGRKDIVRIVPDENNEDKLNMTKLMEHILTLAKSRYNSHISENKEVKETKAAKKNIEVKQTLGTDQSVATTSNTKKTIELGELKFSIVDKKGRKLNIMIKNDSENEQIESSEEETPDKIESTYYHLMVEDQKVLPYKRTEKKGFDY